LIINSSKQIQFTAQHHSEDNYSRTELWLPHVQEYLLTPENIPLPLLRNAAAAILQMRDGVKMRANLNDMQKKLDTGTSLKDPLFLEIAEKEEWDLQSNSHVETTQRNFRELLDLCSAIDKIIEEKYQKSGTILIEILT
jgi:hypothetical protein